MTPEELKQLQAEHDKAMEGIKAFNDALKDDVEAMKDYIGVAK